MLQHAICYQPSVCLAVTRVDQSKTVEVRIMHPSPQSSPMTSFLTLNFTGKFQREDRELGRRIKEGYIYIFIRMKNTPFSANKSPYLRNSAK